ncbi:hypothetical protein BDN70DRAFT_929651 [Pholiota conissans]|uniref:Cytochrome c oxidase subunit 8, mitochondrial n=1 Tax=Pholiota conissans TaxID=109636 RepID=A0A9P5Z9W0_9AGAR|nr:hypothetical protein BDN70DRAFT_929651 [Pholiota conissans]
MSSLFAARAMRSGRSIPISRQILRQPTLKRLSHSEAVDPHDRCIPFSTSNRRALAVKALLYMGGGFSIPFIAVWYGWNRPGGLNNPILD